jgi:hypothetical protein
LEGSEADVLNDGSVDESRIATTVGCRNAMAWTGASLPASSGEQAGLAARLRRRAARIAVQPQTGVAGPAPELRDDQRQRELM